MKKQSGFTLLELIIAMAIISMIMAGVFMAFTIAMRMFADEMNRSGTYLEADRGMSRMTGELMGARSILYAGSREVTFWLDDLNGDGTMEGNEVAEFTWSGSPEASLYRIMNGSNDPISYGVTGFLLTYDNPAAPNLVNIALTVGRGTSVVTLESSVKLRNI